MAMKPNEMYRLALDIAKSQLEQAEDALRIARKNKTTEGLDQLQRDVKEARARLTALQKAKSPEQRQAAVDDVMDVVYGQFGEYVSELIQRVPEIAQILNDAVNGSWSTDRFVDAIRASDWWKAKVAAGTETSWFEAFKAEYGSYGADWNELLAASEDALTQEFAKYGVNFADLDDAVKTRLKRAYQYENWSRDQDELQAEVSRVVRQRGTTGAPGEGQVQQDFGPGTTLGNLIAVLRDRALQFGLTPKEDWIRAQATRLLQDARADRLTMTDIDEVLTRRATRTFGLEEGDIGFGPGLNGDDGQGNLAARSLQEAVFNAIQSGGAAARRLLGNQQIAGFLGTWRDSNNTTFKELLETELESRSNTIASYAQSIGLRLSSAELDYYAREDLYNNWSEQQMQQALYGRKQTGTSPVPDDGTGTGPGTGEGDTTTGGGPQQSLARQVREWLREYGLYDIPDSWVQEKVALMLNPDPMTGLTEADVRNQIIDLAKQRFPDFADQIDANRTMRDLTLNYRARMSQLLEVQMEDVELNDPLLESVLTRPTGSGPMSLSDFAKAVRGDDRWQFTENARNTYMDAASGFLSKMGFVG